MSTLWGTVSLLSKRIATGLLALSVSVVGSKAMFWATRPTLALALPAVVGVVPFGDVFFGGAVSPVLVPPAGAVVGPAAWPGSPPPVPVTVRMPVMFGWTSQW